MAEEEDFESRQFLSFDLICSSPGRPPLPVRARPTGYGVRFPGEGAAGAAGARPGTTRPVLHRARRLRPLPSARSSRLLALSRADRGAVLRRELRRKLQFPAGFEARPPQRFREGLHRVTLLTKAGAAERKLLGLIAKKWSSIS